MSLTRRHLLQGVAAAPALWINRAAARPALGRIVVGFAAGGTLDVIARRIADQLGGNFADSVIVEGRTGAGGRIAIDATKIANPDGTTTVSVCLGAGPTWFKARVLRHVAGANIGDEFYAVTGSH